MPANPRRRVLAAAAALATLAAACSGGGSGPDAAGDDQPLRAQLASVEISPPVDVDDHGALNPTVAVDPAGGAMYVAWAEEVDAPDGVVAAEPAGATGHAPDPVLRVLVARSDDGGQTFSAPVVASGADDHIDSFPVAPARVAVGADGDVLVLYRRAVPMPDRPELSHGLRSVRLVRSTDGGRTFSAPVDVGATEVEGVESSRSMHNVHIADDGDVYVSWLDFRAEEQYLRDHPGAGEGGHGDEAPEPPVQLRVARSTDGGVTFAPSTLVTEANCDCCGTHMASDGDRLYASTRTKLTELKDSKDEVRDIWVAASPDRGATWAAPVKVHDDQFKISGCPDVTAGLAVDSDGVLHAAWYTGTDRRPGYFYATSDDGGKTFSEPVPLLTDDWMPYGDLKLALDGDDRPWIALEDRREDVDQIQVIRVGPDGGVEFSEAWTGTAPDLVIDDGSPVVVWGAPDTEAGTGAVGLARVLDA